MDLSGMLLSGTGCAASPDGRCWRMLVVAVLLSGGMAPAAHAVDASPSQEIRNPDPIGDMLASTLIKDRLSLIVEHNYFDWKDDQNGRGRQSITPVTMTYRHGNMNFGLRRAYIDSINHTPGRQGSVSTWSDTSISAAYTFKVMSWHMRANLDYNLPNGKATLSGSEKNAIMDGSLVQQTRFGEGENITPGIGLTRAFGAKDVLGLGMSYVKRGSFDPNGDVANDVLDPGDETIATVQWQHSEEKWLVIGGLIYTASGVTQRDRTDYYKKGDRYDLNLTGVVALPYQQSLQASLRYSTQKPDQYLTSFGNLQQESANSNGDSVYVNLDWSKRWQGAHTFHVLADYLQIDANSYDQINDLYNAGRKKTGIGLGYDYAWNKKTSISVQARHFRMTDKATPATLRDTEYRGNNVYAIFRHAF